MAKLEDERYIAILTLKNGGTLLWSAYPAYKDSLMESLETAQTSNPIYVGFLLIRIIPSAGEGPLHFLKGVFEEETVKKVKMRFIAA